MKLNPQGNALEENEYQKYEKGIQEILATPELLKETKYQEKVNDVLRAIEQGFLRVVSPPHKRADCGDVDMSGDLMNWTVHNFVKESILLAMKMRRTQTFFTNSLSTSTLSQQERPFAGTYAYHDKFDMQNLGLGDQGVRCVYGSIVREGCYVSPNTIMMPSFVNLGAWIGEGTMMDTWSTAGSCAQIGRHVHIAGGVGIGGVLEPVNNRPVMIGDHAFIGSRAILVEGVCVSSRAVIGANVCLTASTPIYDMTTSEKKEYRGFVPENAVVANGTRLKKFPGGEAPLQCAYIIAYRSNKTDAKVSLNHILRETGLSV